MSRQTIKEILTSKVISVLPATPLSDSVSLMEQNSISCLVVGKDNHPVGIFTERDLVLLASRGVPIKDLEIKDVMSPSVITAEEDMDIFEAYRLLTTNRIRHLVVVDDKDEIIGVVTLSNIVNKLGLEYFVELKNILSIMTKTVITIRKDRPVRDAVSKMAEKSISCIVAEEGGIPTGILTERDVIHLYRRGEDVGSLLMEEVMSRPVQTVHADITVHEAANIMHQKKLRRLVVVNEEGRLAGLITQHDIIKNFEIKYIDILKKIILEKEQALQESERLLSERIVLDNILRYSTDMAIIATDLDFRIVYYNPAAESIFGHKAGEAVGRNAVEIHAGEGSGPSPFETSKQFVCTGDAYKYEFERKERDQTHFIESTITGIRDSGSSLVGYVLMARDITKRRNAEAVLRANEEKYRSIINTTSEGYWEVDAEGKISEVNNSLCSMLGYGREEILGRRPTEFVDAGNARIFEEQLALRAFTRNRNYSITLRTRDGGDICTRFHSSSLMDPTGSLLGSFAFITDITELLQIEGSAAKYALELERSNTELQNFAYIASHDLQEPLRKIVAFGDRLKTASAGALDAQANDYLERMQKAARRMQSLIEDLLQYSRVTTKARPFVPADLGSIVRDELIDLEERISQTGGTVTIEELPTIEADRVQMGQLFRNLISNALKFHREGTPPRVVLRSRKPEAGMHEIEIEDNGIGFDEKYLDRLFKPFSRLHGKGEYEGTGMGLAICNKIVQRHGGRIVLRSSPGRGTMAILRLPQRPTLTGGDLR